MQITNLARAATSFTANAYLINGTDLVDAGSDATIIDQLADTELDTIVITHSHHDHIENLPQIVADHDATVYAYSPEHLPVQAQEISEGDTVQLGGSQFDVYHTPGHRDDSICLYAPDDKILFAGDLLFPGGSFGRTDLDEGDRDLLIQSIETINDLHVEALFAGHDQPTNENVDEQIQQSLANAKRREPKYD